MSQPQTTQAPHPASGRYSKRKRAQINYYEQFSDSEDNLSDHDSQDVVKYSRPKKSKRAAHSTPKHKTFPFLQLPAEIRNIIYDYCLMDPAGIYLAATTKKYRRTVERIPPQETNLPGYPHWTSDSGRNDKSEPEARALVPSLLAVSKQIHQESHGILYGNEFKLLDPLAMHSFLVDCGPRVVLLLKKVTLLRWNAYRGMHKGYNHSAFALLASATNLTQFRFEGYLACRSLPKWVARQIYRDAFPWLEAVGAAKGQADAAVTLMEVSRRNFQSSWYNRRETSDTNQAKDMQQFREELSKLLHARQKMMTPKKPSKKVAKGE